MIEHNYVAHEREVWSVCTRCGMVRNYYRPIAGCRGVMGNICTGCLTMVRQICPVCARPTGFGDEDKFEPPVNLARCPAPGGMECRAVAQAVVPWRRENETLRANCDHLRNLVESYQQNSMEADERLRAVRKLLEENGCECPCDHHPDERGDDCEVCLACLIGEAVGK